MSVDESRCHQNPMNLPIHIVTVPLFALGFSAKEQYFHFWLFVLTSGWTRSLRSTGGRGSSRAR